MGEVGAGTTTGVVWPVKQRELVKWVIDSRPWNDFTMRDDDIVITTWAKSGTTWMQQIVGQLIFSGEPDLYCEGRSPWIEFRLRDGDAMRAAEQTHRRYLKSHLAIDALVYSPSAKYISLGRDIRDTYWSWHNHHMSLNEGVLAFISSLYPDQPPATYPDPDTRTAFFNWLENDAHPNWSFWDYSQGWFDARHLPNLKLVHFADLLADLPGQIRQIAAFLEIEIDPRIWPDVLEHCSFDYMRRLAVAREGMRTIFREGGASFFHRGTNGRWRDVLSASDNARVNAIVAEHLTPDCARWLVTGELPH
jgi:aryl sulfotransferase